MFVRQLEYLVALARERHFGRAAESCHVSQPALSGAIRHLEQELDVVIVQRSHRFIGFTPEGERILAWARQTRAALDGLKQEASASHAQLSGVLRIGAIPSAMPLVSQLTGACWRDAPGISFQVLSLSTEEITRRLDAFELDLGMTYLEDPRLDGFRTQPLYQERYVLLTQRKTFATSPVTLTWQDLEGLPLCLLTSNMQNRRIINAAFRRARVQPTVVVETDSIFALYTHVKCAGLSSEVPHSLLGPVNHDNMPPLQSTAWRIASTIDISPELNRRVPRRRVSGVVK